MHQCRTVLLLQSIGALPVPTAPSPKGAGIDAVTHPEEDQEPKLPRFLFRQREITVLRAHAVFLILGSNGDFPKGAVAILIGGDVAETVLAA